MHSSTLDDLLQCCDNLLRFLEKNHQNDNVINLKPASFEHLFSKFKSYYQEGSKDLMHRQKKLKLIDVELLIHRLANFSATQDISYYLSLLEDHCHEGRRLCGLMYLLFRKHDTTVESYDDVYKEWLHFMLPFLSYLSAIGFNYSLLILNLKKDADRSLIGHYLDIFTTEIKKLRVSVKLNHLNTNDPELLLSELVKLKKIVIGLVPHKKADFYYTLGLWSFLVYLLRSYCDKDHTFFSLCMITSIYSGIFVRFDVS